LTLRALPQNFSDIATFGVIGLPFFLLWAWTQNMPLAVIVLGVLEQPPRLSLFCLRWR
jgi:hypothetical protein